MFSPNVVSMPQNSRTIRRSGVAGINPRISSQISPRRSHRRSSQAMRMAGALKASAWYRTARFSHAGLVGSRQHSYSQA